MMPMAVPSTSLINKDLVKAAELLCTNGFEMVELSYTNIERSGVDAYSAYNHIQSALSTLQRLGCKAPVIHAPWEQYLSLFLGSGLDNLIGKIKLVIDLASKHDAHIIVLHLIPQNYIGEKQAYTVAHKILSKLVDYKEKERLNIRIALENLAHGNPWNKFEKLISLIQHFNNDMLGLCIDVGHAHINKYTPTTLDRILFSYNVVNKVFCIHINDNDGANDTHSLPGCGTIDWSRLLSSQWFRIAEYWVLESECKLKSVDACVVRALSSMSMIEKLHYLLLGDSKMR